MRTRQRIPPTDDWQQLELLLETPGQRSYEVIRPVVLSEDPVPERATPTQTHARTLYRTVAGSEVAGLRGLEPRLSSNAISACRKKFGRPPST